MATRTDPVYGDLHVVSPHPSVSVVAIPAAEVKTLIATPVELVPAPGADKIIEFIGAVFVLTTSTSGFHSTPSSEISGALTIGLGTTPVWQYATPTGVLVVTSGNKPAVYFTDGPNVGTPGTGTDTSEVNAALKLWNAGGVEYAGQDDASAVLTVRVHYRIHPTA